jgi:hypothetical protein
MNVVAVTVVGTILAALFGLNIFILRGLKADIEAVREAAADAAAEAKETAARAHQRLDEHENRQSEVVRAIEAEMAELKGNYKDRFNQVNLNILAVKEVVLNELSELKLGLASSGVHFKTKTK